MEETPDWLKLIIRRTWDDKSACDPIEIIIKNVQNEVLIDINAPFYNDPPAPKGEAGQPFDKLWDYEVVEVFFLASDGKYLETEFSPHGQHLLLMLSGKHKLVKKCLPISYKASVCPERPDRWCGLARIPMSYFPPNVQKINAYAIHGSNEKRTYKAAFPVPTGKFEFPDFHRLEYFEEVDFSHLIPSDHLLSEIWEKALEETNKGEEPVCSKE